MFTKIHRWFDWTIAVRVVALTVFFLGLAWFHPPTLPSFRPLTTRVNAPSIPGDSAASPFLSGLKIRRLRHWHEVAGENGSDWERIEILEADFHYPLIRLVKKLTRDPATGEERVRQISVMVADHLVVKLQPGQSAAALGAQFKILGVTVRRGLEADRIVLLEFPVADDDDPLPRVQAALQQEVRWIASVDPYYLDPGQNAPQAPTPRKSPSMPASTSPPSSRVTVSRWSHAPPN